MQSFLAFIIKYKNTLFFLLLVAISAIIFVQSHYYQRAKCISSINGMAASLYEGIHGIEVYVSLKKNNQLLVEENKKLREMLYNREKPVEVDSFFSNSYEIIPAAIIKNSFSNTKNYLTLNRGSQHGIARDMGVITSRGVVGIVEETSEHFSLVQSLLNRRSAINAKVKRTQHFGSLQWNGKDYKTVQLVDIPRLADVKIGDTIVTGGMSAIFPEGIPIGVIDRFRLTASQNYFEITVALFTDMASIAHVYVIKNNQKKELLKLEESLKDE
jgi:rod shape-determining protein MreC